MVKMRTVTKSGWKKFYLANGAHSSKSYAHPLIVLITLPMEQGEGPRVGVAAGRSVGKAVQRNRAKRLLRAAIRPYLNSIDPGRDVLLIARRPLLGAPFQQIEAGLFNLLMKAGLLTESYDS